MKIRLTLMTLCLLVVALSCQKDTFTTVIKAPELPAQMYAYAPKWGGMLSHMEGQDLGITDAGATLGRVLFYDKILSIDNSISCGSCHHQANAFSDAAKESLGINDQKTTRNAPAISNLYDDNLLFWDGRSPSINDLVLRPIRNHKEMGMENMDFLVAKIKAAPYYTDLFTKAFGNADVSSDRIADAMSQFVKSMVGCNSEMDKSAQSGQPLSPLAEMGKNVFFGKGTCYNCHSGPDFNSRGSFFVDPFFPPNGGGFGWAQNIADIGLDKNYTDVGMGVFDQALVGVFRIPSLRNVAMTAPYMHDGRFATLEEVVNHYNRDIQKSPNLDNVFKSWDTGEAITLGLSDEEASSLVAFLHTLTDTEYLADQRFADPFIE
ncbi:MAG TPA: cytochrome c peroxidase [Saprospiraceae bacterium]|nr:cytochrome c peroxidase [Saprospiraceae bacterium]